MSFETLFVLWPNCLLALPTLLATAWTSTPDIRGTGTPRMVFRREWPLSTSPPASPTAVAPMATAGPLTLLAAPLMVPTTPLPPLPFWLATLRPALPPPPLRLAVVLDRAAPLLDRDALERDLLERALLERALLERPAVEAFGVRDALPVARVERLRDEVPPLLVPLFLALDPDVLDEPRLL